MASHPVGRPRSVISQEEASFFSSALFLFLLSKYFCCLTPFFFFTLLPDSVSLFLTRSPLYRLCSVFFFLYPFGCRSVFIECGQSEIEQEALRLFLCPSYTFRLKPLILRNNLLWKCTAAGLLVSGGGNFNA